MKKSKLLGSLALAGLLTLGLASCGGKQSWNYEDAEFEDLTVSVSAATVGNAVSFVNESYEERAKILGLLEEYAVKNALTGLVLYDDGGYAKYSDRLVFPTPVKKDENGKDVEIAGTKQHEYITGYGFGVVAEGGINGTLSGISGPYASYYHTYESEDPKTLNYWDDKGSVVSNYHGYVASGYFDIKMNDTKDGYVWYPAAATEVNKVGNDYRPLPYKDGAPIANANFQTMANTYRIYVRTGADFKYATASTNSKVSAFNGREVALEDYVTSVQQLFTQGNGLARGAENLTGAAAIKGMAAYYNASADGVNEEAWKNVGMKTGSDDKGDYLEFELVTPCTPFYAMYYLSSSLYCPIPADFLEAIGGIKIWGSYDGTKALTPVDTTLSTGPFVVEAWNDDQSFVFKNNAALNPTVKGGNRYTVNGVHVAVLQAVKTDSEAAWKEFKAGKLDAVGIPKTQVDAGEINTAGTQVTKGSSTTKLNINTCTEEEWEYLFGENGTVTTTQKSNYWKVKPALSDEDFLLGLSWAIDRKSYAEARGVTPSLNYFSDAYLSNPEAGVSYNDTAEHKAAMDAVYGEGWESNYGYDFDKAVEYFHTAATRWLADGTYKEGDEIEIEICWQAETQIKSSGDDLALYLETAFNAPEVCDGKLTLKIKNVAVATWSDVYYQKMMIGQYDIGFGGISGNTLNPLNFMEVLKSDNSSGFTLNFGPNTNADPSIEYKGQKYTYDALWTAADTGAVVTNDGKLAKYYDAALMSNKKNDGDASRTVKIKFAASNITDVVETEVSAVVCCWYGGEEYDEQEVEFTVNNGVIEIVISQELAELYQGEIGFDVIFTVTVKGAEPSEHLVSLYGYFPEYK